MHFGDIGGQINPFKSFRMHHHVPETGMLQLKTKGSSISQLDQVSIYSLTNKDFQANFRDRRFS